ncbi:MAG TPA: class I SAM-dependent methyltransferase [Puia sp.]|jgi:SAM-dependent methyltransferase|nr:class I SAM-dependent methyltransferase [Puia sp.]
MPSAFEQKVGTDEENISFYNEIASDYDAILDQESSNEIIRNRVKEKLLSTVEAGWVLDFGGGTGRDLDWLLSNRYKIIFCEPSVGMRQKAISRYEDEVLANNIIFLENDKVDFTNWHIKLPFSIKVDAILSDFAVINCIADIDLLFKNLAQIIKPGGHMIALMLNHGHKKNWRWKVREFIKSVISRKPAVINVKYKEHQQTVYIYSPGEVKRASSIYFDICSNEILFEFTLFHFVRK